MISWAWQLVALSLVQSNQNSVVIRYGNSYTRLNHDEAPYDRSGAYKKIHDWTLYVDVIGNADIIQNVAFDLGPSFSPTRFVCHSPVPAKTNFATSTRSSGRGQSSGETKVMRFSTRQTTYAPITADILIRGASGTLKRFSHDISVHGNSRPKKDVFVETRPLKPLKMKKMPNSAKFGIELELTSASNITPEYIADYLQSRSGFPVVVYDSYSAGRQTQNNWKLVPDASIVCNRCQPNCNSFELVSPILESGEGLSKINRILSCLEELSGEIKVNKSMGFHVHIDVSKYNLQQIKKICQNFIKYEPVMDYMMPPSRRTGSDESNRYFQSNLYSVANYAGGGGGGRTAALESYFQALDNCRSIQEVAKVMNSGSNRYYKLNLQNLATGRQPTLEFRQHSATAKYDKVAAWVRFCTNFCSNSARLKRPSPFTRNGPASSSLERQFECLFWYVIKDRAIRHFYLERQAQLQIQNDPVEYN